MKALARYNCSVSRDIIPRSVSIDIDDGYIPTSRNWNARNILVLSSDETTGVLSKYFTFISVTVLPPIGLKWNTSTSNANLTSPRECHYLSYPTRNGRPSARTRVYATWKTMVFLQNGNVDIARSGGLSPEPCSPQCACMSVYLRRSGILGTQRTSLEQLP